VRAAATCLLLLVILSWATPFARGDLDVNTVVGIITLDGAPAPAGTLVTVRDISNGHMATTSIDGSLIPFFLLGEGRYDTGNVPAFNTGDEVEVRVAGARGYSRARLKAGTTTVNLAATSNNPPRINPVPEQRGLEDVGWTLDLTPYIKDQDTSPSRLVLISDSQHARVDGLTLSFLYPEGVTLDTVRIVVSDGFDTDSAFITVRVTPVNDPPVLDDLPDVLLEQGENTSLDLAPYLSDPDHDTGLIELTLVGSGPLSGSFWNSTLLLSSPPDWTGDLVATVTATDPGGLSTSAGLRVVVEPNYPYLVGVLTEKIELLEGLLESARRERDEALLSKSRLLESMDALANRTEEMESVLASTRQEADDLRRRMEEERGEASELEESLRGKLANLTAQIDLRETAIGEMGARISELLAEHDLVVELAREREERLNATIHSLESIAREREDLLARARENNTDLAGEIARLLVREGNLLEDLDDLEGERSSLAVKLANITGTVELLESEETAQEAVIAYLGEEVQRLQVERADLERELEEKADEVVSVSRSARARQDTIEAMHQRNVRDMGILFGVLLGLGVASVWAVSRHRRLRRATPTPRGSVPAGHGGVPRSRPGMMDRVRSVKLPSFRVDRFSTGIRWSPGPVTGGLGLVRTLARKAWAPFGLLARRWKYRVRARRRALSKLRARRWRRERSRFRAQARVGAAPGRNASPRHGTPSRRKARWRYALRPGKIPGMLGVGKGGILRSPVPRSQRMGSRSRWGSWQSRFPDSMQLGSGPRRDVP